MHNESVIPQTERRSLRYDFSATEIYDLSLKLAGKTREFNTVTEEKKSINSQYTATLNEIKATCNKLSNQVSDGWEMRDTECSIEFNKPEQGKKTLTRKDTNAVIIEKMEPWEWNLFTSVGADDALPDVVPAPKPKKPRRGKKQSTDILDELEGIEVPIPKGKNDDIMDIEMEEDDKQLADDLPFL